MGTLDRRLARLEEQWDEQVSGSRGRCTHGGDHQASLEQEDDPSPFLLMNSVKPRILPHMPMAQSSILSLGFPFFSGRKKEPQAHTILIKKLSGESVGVSVNSMTTIMDVECCLWEEKGIHPGERNLDKEALSLLTKPERPATADVEREEH
jgi:hypothetical protein